MKTMPSLPEKFAGLEPWVDTWCMHTERERNERRIASDIEELQRFYDAMLPRMKEILQYLGGFNLENLPPEVERLFLLSLAVAEIAPAIEFYGSPIVPDTFGAERFKFVHQSLTGLYPRPR